MLPLRQFEKNWSPFDLYGRLHFVRLFAPLQILRCPPGFPVALERKAFVEEDCELVHGDDGDDGSVARGEFHVGSLRGGSPFVPWGGGPGRGTSSRTDEYEPRRYFVSVAHSTTAFAGRHFYRMHVVVLQVAPVFSLVFVSDPLKLPVNRTMTAPEFESFVDDAHPKGKEKEMENDDDDDEWWPMREGWLHLVEFASSLHFEAPLVPRYGGDKIWVLGMHVNDQVPLMARIEGLDRLVATAIEAHEKHEKRECSRVSVDVDAASGASDDDDDAASIRSCRDATSAHFHDEQALVEKAVQLSMRRYVEELRLETPPVASSSGQNPDREVLLTFTTGDKQHEFGLWKDAPVDDITALICEDSSFAINGPECARIRKRARDLTSRLNAGAPMGEWLSLPMPLRF